MVLTIRWEGSGGRGGGFRLRTRRRHWERSSGVIACHSAALRRNASRSAGVREEKRSKPAMQRSRSDAGRRAYRSSVFSMTERSFSERESSARFWRLGVRLKKSWKASAR